ncbi:MAG: hypothetical protein K2H90_01500 [Oscillospiraceae bacterium]|nr:hypothetical protein [Oscillospiraceae bacterium]
MKSRILVSSKRIARKAYTRVTTTGKEIPVCDRAKTEMSAPIPMKARSFSRHKNSIGAAFKLSG